VKINKIAIILLALALAASLGTYSPVSAGQPTGYDLVAAVNAYRAANGYYAFNANSLVMAAAQAHADWIVQTGQGGHTGSGGSDETMRVSWTRYGGGASIKCDENWAASSSVEEAIYSAWSDWTHQEVMLNSWGNRYTDAGGGVADWGNGLYVFVLDVCLVEGQSSTGAVPSTNPNSGDAAETQATADLSNYVYGVNLATPQADGSIKHTVLNGQTLTAIATAYGVTLDQLRELNQMAADDSNIWVGEELLIQPAGSALPTAAASPTAAPQAETAPTAMQITPTRIAQAYVPPPTQTAAGAPTATVPAASPAERQTYQIFGILLIAVSGVGLAVMLFLSNKR